jgi:hypothetical protein
MGVSVVKNRLAGDGNQVLHHLQVRGGLRVRCAACVSCG